MGIVQDWFDRMFHGTVYFMAAVADQVTHWGISGATGMPSKRMDHQFHASKSYTYMELDSSTDEWQTRGPMRLTRQNALSRRYELKWIAGQRGLVTVNASVLFSTDHDFELLGTNAVAGDVTAYAEGGLNLATHGADLDSSIFLPYLATAVSPWKTNTWGTHRETEWECDIQTNTSVATTIIWAGLKLTNTPTAATDADQVYFLYTNGVSSGDWVCTSSIATVLTSTDSGVAVAASTRYHLKITIDTSRVARFYINGTLAATTAALTNAVNFIPYIGIKANGAAAVKTLRVHSQAIGRAIA